MLIAVVSISPCMIDHRSSPADPIQRRVGAAAPDTQPRGPFHVAAQTMPTRSRGALSKQLCVITVGLALFNDILLLLMIVPMLPSLLSPPPVGVGAPGQMSVAVIFSAKDAFQLIFAPVAGALTQRTGAREVLAGGLIGLAAATIAFAEARTFEALLLARTFQAGDCKDSKPLLSDSTVGHYSSHKALFDGSNRV